MSYLGRNDLAHVDVSEIANTGLGSSDEELEEQAPPPAARYLSRGLLRGQEGRVLALRSSTSAVAIAVEQDEPASPVASLQQEVQWRELRGGPRRTTSSPGYRSAAISACLGRVPINRGLGVRHARCPLLGRIAAQSGHLA